MPLAGGGVRCERAEGASLERSELEQELDDLHAMLQTALEDVRGYLAAMQPPSHSDASLTTSLERCARELFRGEDVSIQVAVQPPGSRLSRETENAAFYIAREALFNARKHAQARRVVLELRCRHDSVTVTISDDGRGFDAEAGGGGELSGHRGLRTMRERAESVGGRLRCTSASGSGTCIIAELPSHHVSRAGPDLQTGGFGRSRSDR